MKILETERLILRTWQASDESVFIAMNQDPEVMGYFPSLQTEAQSRELIQKIHQHYQEKGLTLYAVELKSTKQFIGFCGLMEPSFEAHFTPAIEVGWRLAREHWGHGYATEAAKAVLHHAFTKLELGEVVSFTSVVNKPSIRVMEKIGLTHNPDDDFDHPKLDADHPLCRHVLYRLDHSRYDVL